MKIDREDLLGKMGEKKKEGFSYLVKITAVDYDKHIEVIYFLRDMARSKDDSIEVEIAPSDAWVPTVTQIYRSADWYEREMAEMFGIEIKNRNARRLLLEKWNGKPSPLRKNFGWGEPYERE
ncbi:NADH-quinone oxidoreductase subunit C/D [uncultured archaeon]|nr:NADH-quinone oxidoreductase subunit C/D [uncultured archaeon]